MKEDLVETILDFIVLIIVLIFGAGEVWGIFHSVKKHYEEDGIMAIVFPPFAWYRAIESFWHDDFKDIDWDKQIDQDVETCINFLQSSMDSDVDEYRLHKNIDEFSEVIHNYPKNKLNELESAATAFICYTASKNNDVYNALNGLIDSCSFSLNPSQSTIRMEIKLLKYMPDIAEEREKTIADLEDTFIGLVKEYGADGVTGYLSDINLKNLLRDYIDEQIKAMEDTYQRIFGVKAILDDEYLNGDVDKQIAEDANTAVYLMHASMDPEIDKDKMNQKIEKFSNRIHKYPEKRIQELDNVVTMYITYSDYMWKDMINFLNNIKDTSGITRQSDSTLHLAKKLEKYIPRPITCESKSFSSAIDSFLTLPPKEIEDLPEYIEFYKETTMQPNLEICKNVYQQIFDHEFSSYTE